MSGTTTRKAPAVPPLPLDSPPVRTAAWLMRIKSLQPRGSQVSPRLRYNAPLRPPHADLHKYDQHISMSRWVSQRLWNVQL